MQKVKNKEEKLWYIQEVIKNGWSRNIVETWIEADLYKRESIFLVVTCEKIFLFLFSLQDLALFLK